MNHEDTVPHRREIASLVRKYGDSLTKEVLLEKYDNLDNETVDKILSDISSYRK